MKHQSLGFRTKSQPGRFAICMSIVYLVVGAVDCNLVNAEGWMTYRHDRARSGVTSEQVVPPLSLRWIWKPTHAPKPAWPEPAEELPRMHSDNAYHVVVANGRLYFGCSVDNKVYAVNAKTGKVEWTFFTEGPVRFAPTLWNGRVYVGSDDGYVYCLRARNGRPIWKYRAAYSDEKVIGNGRMISLWPVRTSVLVDDGVVYFGAGVFPYEGIYICALKADDGTVIWKNDTIGDHAHELDYGGISPHGYLIASEDILYVPSGRALPAAFNRKSGEFLYYMQPSGPPTDKYGGTWALLEDDALITGVERLGTPAKVVYNIETGKKMGDAYAAFPGIDMVVADDLSYTLTEDGIAALDREEIAKKELEVTEKEIKELRGKLFDLRRKLDEIGEGREEREEIIEKISHLEEEQKEIKNFICESWYGRKDLCCLILAGNVVFAGGEGIVIAVDAQTGKELWSGKVDGKAYGLAASNKNLFVSTEKGSIYCFGEGEVSTPNEIGPNINSSPYPKDELTALYESGAETIVKETDIQKGYCLVLGCGTGRLAFEIAKRTELKIVGIEENPEKVKIAKKRLDEAGLYGSRVIVEQWKLASLPDYFANLIVSDKVMLSGKPEGSAEEMFRVLRPYGGIAYLGQPRGTSKIVKSLDLENLVGWLKSSGGGEPEMVRENGVWAKLARGKLEGAGTWTHLYANPQNTACSDDQLVRSPLGVLWFGEPGPKGMVERHARAAAPVAINGRLFVQGEEKIMAYDAYNGTLLWKKEIPGAVRVRVDVDGGNLAATENGLYVAAYDKCYRLDPARGEAVRVYQIPPSPDGSPRRWGYISCTDNILYGSRAEPLERKYAALWKIFVENGKWKNIDEIIPQTYEDNSGDEGFGSSNIEYRVAYEKYTSKYPVPDENARAAFQRDGALWHPMTDFPGWENYYSSQGSVTERMMVSDMIFAMDPETGKLLWAHHGNRIANITVTIGEGKIFFAESAANEEQKKQTLKDREELIRKGIYKVEAEANLKPEDADVRLIVALDAATGKELWRRSVNLTGCCGDAMGTAYHDGVLLFFGNVGNHDAYRFQEGQLKYRRIVALSAKTGDVLWSRPLNYRTRPLIVGDKIIIEPRACELHTGKIVMRSHPITGEQVPWEFLRPGHTCAITSASPNCLFYRSACTAFYDLAGDRGLTLFGAIRPGCWINLIAANGLLLFPEASSGCTCSLPLRCSVALVHKHKRPQPWTVFITHGPMTPPKHFAINLGAPGDMKDDEGTLWFGYPNPKTEYWNNHFPDYGVKFDLHEELLPGMGYFCQDFKGVDIEETDKPWLFTSGCLGLLRCNVPLIGEDEPFGAYTVRLGFAALAGDLVGQRVFDIRLRDNLVLENFDILKEVGAPKKAVVKEFKGVEVKNALTVELVPKVPDPTIEQATLINFIEVIREKN